MDAADFDWLQMLFGRGREEPLPTESHPRLEGKDIPSLAKYMKSDKCKNVFVMLGAGVSTSAGIPDFRSPKTGLYANLARLNLPHPEAVFEMSFFRVKPQPFYTLAKELYPGRYRPTLSHTFIKLLSQKNLLRMCFTQNIDTLERRAGIPNENLIEAHGSFATQRCIECRRPFDDLKMKEFIRKAAVPRCEYCDGLVKPDIVFFEESLPLAFAQAIPSLQEADLLIVMGTSLTVHPFASLANRVPPDCPRVLINLDKVGNFGSQIDDVVLLGECDCIAKQLCVELGWEKELIDEWEATAGSVEQHDADDVVDQIVGEEHSAEDNLIGPSEKVEDVVDQLADVLAKSMDLIADEMETELTNDAEQVDSAIPPPPKREQARESGEETEKPQEKNSTGPLTDNKL